MPLLNERRRNVYPPLLVSVAALWITVGIAFFWVRAEQSGTDYGGDFNTFWSAAELAAAGEPEAAYDRGALLAQERKTNPDTGLYPFNYPPFVLAALRPLAWMPFGAALAAWTVFSVVVFAGTLWALGLARPAVVALSIVPVAANAVFGQNGVLTGSILAGGLALSGKRPLLGGAVLGLLCYKPHFLPLVLLALLVNRNWRSLCGAAASGVLLVASSFVLVGPQAWGSFFEGISRTGDSLYESGSWEKMTSTVAALQLLGLPREFAQAGQAAWSFTVIGLVLWAVRQPAEAGSRYAVLIAGTLCVTPYSFVYDMALLTPALGWLLASSRRTTVAEWFVFGAVACTPLVLWGVAERTSVLFTPLVLGALLAVALVRVRAEARAALPESWKQRAGSRRRRWNGHDGAAAGIRVNT